MGRLLVDGMNVVGSRPNGWWRDRPTAMAALVEQIAAWAGVAGDHVTVVFDGRPLPSAPPGSGERVTLAFTGSETSADDEIARRVTHDPRPWTLTVVTSDVALATRVRAGGAAVIGSGRFRRLLDEKS